MLVLDQFEELFVVGTEPARHEFIHQLAALMERSSAATVILIMRDDFYSRFLQEAPVLASWLERGLVNIPPVLERGQIADIVREPARAVGLALQDGLVERIVDDTLETVDAYRAPAARTTILPLLEFALTQLWERRHDGMLTHDAYDNVGGVTGGLTQWAEAAYQRLHDHRRLARRIFISLVHLGEPNEGLPDSRWRKSISVLVGDVPGGTERAAVEQVVKQRPETGCS